MVSILLYLLEAFKLPCLGYISVDYLQFCVFVFGNIQHRILIEFQVIWKNAFYWSPYWIPVDSQCMYNLCSSLNGRRKVLIVLKGLRIVRLIISKCILQQHNFYHFLINLKCWRNLSGFLKSSSRAGCKTINIILWDMDAIFFRCCPFLAVFPPKIQLLLCSLEAALWASSESNYTGISNWMFFITLGAGNKRWKC